MAEPRQATVLANLSDPAHGALLALQLDAEADVLLKGGKYIIVNTGRSNAEGKLIKRAYSLFAVKPEPKQFFLAAAAVAGGIASQYLNELQPEERITFSGPWGRFHWPAEAQERQVIAAAFGSGITGILGYLPSIPEDCAVAVYWYRDPKAPLLSESVVAECAARPGLVLHQRLMSDDPLRDLHAVPPFPFTRFIAAGEGTRTDLWFGHLRSQGVSEERMQSEIFYRCQQDQSDAATES